VAVLMALMSSPKSESGPRLPNLTPVSCLSSLPSVLWIPYPHSFETNSDMNDVAGAHDWHSLPVKIWLHSQNHDTSSRSCKALQPLLELLPIPFDSSYLTRFISSDLTLRLVGEKKQKRSNVPTSQWKIHSTSWLATQVWQCVRTNSRLYS
jgi:hypothetical protein